MAVPALSKRRHSQGPHLLWHTGVSALTLCTWLAQRWQSSELTIVATQAATRPPSFVLFVNDVKLFGDDYKLFMERQIRENVGYPGTPLRLFWRGKAPGATRRTGLVVPA